MQDLLLESYSGYNFWSLVKIVRIICHRAVVNSPRTVLPRTVLPQKLFLVELSEPVLDRTVLNCYR